MTNSLLGVMLLTAAGVGQSAPAPDAVRQAVGRSLPFVEKAGVAWINERKCNSCHTVSFLVWAHQEARAAGVQVDAKKLDAWTSWSLDYSLSARQWYRLAEPALKQLQADGVPEATLGKLKPMLNRSFITENEFLAEVTRAAPGEPINPHQATLLKRAMQPRTGEKNDGGSMAAVGQLLLATADSQHALLIPFQQAAPTLLGKWQEPNGSWKAGGQLPRQNRPGPEHDDVVTGWNLLGLAHLDQADPTTKKITAAALAYLRKSKPGKSHERLVVQLLVEHKYGKADGAAPLLKAMLAGQNADGGWSWLPGAASDAFATGQSLYALSIVANSERAALGRAQKYLLDSQSQDGRWVLPPLAITDPKSNEGRVQRLVPIYDFWGTAWAAIGLSRSVAGAK